MGGWDPHGVHLPEATYRSISSHFEVSAVGESCPWAALSQEFPAASSRSPVLQGGLLQVTFQPLLTGNSQALNFITSVFFPGLNLWFHRVV